MRSPTAAAGRPPARRSLRGDEPAPPAKPTGPPAGAGRDEPEMPAVRRHARCLHRFVCAMGAGSDLADDIVQEAFVIAWRRGRLMLAPASLAAFLQTTARHLWLQNHRASARRTAREARVAAATEQLWREHDEGERELRIAALRGCVERLGGRAAVAIRLAYRDGRSRQQIAAALAMSPNGVRTLLARTRKLLEACIRRTVR